VNLRLLPPRPTAPDFLSVLASPLGCLRPSPDQSGLSKPADRRQFFFGLLLGLSSRFHPESDGSIVSLVWFATFSHPMRDAAPVLAGADSLVVGRALFLVNQRVSTILCPKIGPFRLSTVCLRTTTSFQGSGPLSVLAKTPSHAGLTPFSLTIPLNNCPCWQVYSFLLTAHEAPFVLRPPPPGLHTCVNHRSHFNAPFSLFSTARSGKKPLDRLLILAAASLIFRPTVSSCLGAALFFHPPSPFFSGGPGAAMAYLPTSLSHASRWDAPGQ